MSRSLWALPLLLSSLGCASSLSEGPSPDLRLRHIVLYQNGLGYFERTGVLASDRITLRFKEREIDDVLKTVVFVEEGLGPNERPSTVTARLPQSSGGDREAATSIELVLSPQTSRPISIAYAVPAAAWKATYRVILPSADDKAAADNVLLQAWALIDNVGDEDWSSVKITLATGAPLSYASDIRSPTLMERPELKGIYGAPGQVNGPVFAENTPGRDVDHDGIRDEVDACPNEPGTAASDPSRTGCPQVVRVTSAELRILQRVTFDKNSDKIPASASPLVSEIARALLSNPQIRAIEVSGHASDDEKNASDLGYRRAGAVRAALAREGVTTEIRLRSYGTEKPLAPNATEDGRRTNRRVDFTITDQGNGYRTTPPAAPPAPVTGTFEIPKMAQAPSAVSAAEAVAGTLRYAIDNPVTLPKKSSALITLINQSVPGRDVLLYRPDPAAPASALRPFRAVRLESKGDLALLAGSVSVFSGGTFVGEGVLTRLSPGETASIPYAVDGSTEVRSKEEPSRKPLKIVSLSRGVMRLLDEEKITTSYTVTPGRLVPKHLYVRHARHIGYEVVSPKDKDSAEVTPEALLARTTIAPSTQAVIQVVETQTRERQAELTSLTWTEIGAYAEGTTLSADTKKKLSRAIELVRDLRKALDEMEELRRRREDLVERTMELRDSVRSIEKTTQAEALRKTLLDRLTAASKDLDDVAEKLARRGEDVAALRAELKETVRDLTIVPEKEGGEKPAVTL